MAAPAPTRDKKNESWPLWWFARLESALDRGDDKAAAKAIHKLERLGFEVRFTLPVRDRKQVQRPRQARREDADAR